MAFPTIQELFDLTGQVAIITGGARNLGLQMAEALAEAGADVIVTSRSKARAEKAAASIVKDKKVKAIGAQLEVTEESSWSRLIEKALHHLGRIDVLVNNAGGRRVTTRDTAISLPEDIQFIDKRSLTDWHYTIDVNLTGVFLGCRAVIPLMRKAKYGKIINIASTDGIRGRDLRIYKGTGLSPTVPDYLASKAGVINLTRGIAVAVARHGINVNAISPAGFFRGQPEEFVRRYSDTIPLGRMGRDGIDLKGAVVFCASEASAFMVGHNLVIDGGWTAW